MIFMNSSRLLIDFLEKNNASMWMHRLRYKESHFTKRDAFILIGVDMPFYSQTNQYMAGIQKLKQRKSIIMPNIICFYRRTPFKDYNDLKKRCQRRIRRQNYKFS